MLKFRRVALLALSLAIVAPHLYGFLPLFGVDTCAKACCRRSKGCCPHERATGWLAASDCAKTCGQTAGVPAVAAVLTARPANATAAVSPFRPVPPKPSSSPSPLEFALFGRPPPSC